MRLRRIEWRAVCPARDLECRRGRELATIHGVAGTCPAQDTFAPAATRQRVLHPGPGGRPALGDGLRVLGDHPALQPRLHAVLPVGERGSGARLADRGNLPPYRHDPRPLQLQAATGRGVLRERDQIISADTTITQIRLGTGADLDFDALAVGHPHCNRYALSLVVGDTVHDVNVDRTLTAKVLTHLGDTSFPRTDRRAARKAIAALLCRHPDLWWPTLKALAGFAWRARRDLVAARGRVHKLSFFVHNFMDAQHIERERAHACVFMVATAQGPLSMCVHNAKRDSFVLAPLDLVTPQGMQRWEPLRTASSDKNEPTLAAFPLKWMRGRARAAAARARATPTILADGE